MAAYRAALAGPLSSWQLSLSSRLGGECDPYGVRFGCPKKEGLTVVGYSYNGLGYDG